MQYLKIFSRLGYIVIPTDKGLKLEQRARKSIFIGYGDANSHKAYHVFNPTKKTFFYSQIIKFNESTLLDSTKPNHNLMNDLCEEGEEIKDILD